MPVSAPDLSLIHPYAKEDQVSHPVAVTHYQNGNKNLYYINARHVSGTNNPTCETIKAAIESYKPQAVIIESTNDKGFGTRVPVTEVQYADSLARQNGAQVVAGEPPDSVVMTDMLGKGYSPKDVMGFYMLRNIAYNKSIGNTWDETTLAHRLQDMLEYSFPEYKNNLMSFAELRQWYEQHKSSDKPFAAIDISDVTPDCSPEAGYLQKMSSETGLIRERVILGKIASTLEHNDRVVVVYGGGHLIESRPVLEQMFGSKGETAQLVPDKSNASPCGCSEEKDWQVKTKPEEKTPQNQRRFGAVTKATIALLGTVAAGLTLDAMLNHSNLRHKATNAIRGLWQR